MTLGANPNPIPNPNSQRLPLPLPLTPHRKQPATGRPIQTLYGRRRLDWFSRHPNGFATELSSMPLIKQAGMACLTLTRTRTRTLTLTLTIKQLAGSAWACTGSWHALSLGERGDAMGGASADARGRWGSMNDPTLGDEACPVYRCIFVDVRGQQHNVRVSSAHDELVAFAAHDMRAPLATCKPKK